MEIALETLLTLPVSLAIAVVLLMVIALSAWRFHRWLLAHDTLETSDRIKCWDIFIKAVSTLTVVVAGVMAFFRYIDQRTMELSQQRLQTAQTEREFNLEIYGRSGSTQG